jgi:hypothetical protein
MAVGYGKSGSGTYLTLAESWNGSRWRVAASPSRGSFSDLYGVSCLSATSCIAVGTYAPVPSKRAPFAETWNGRTWKTEQIPLP